MNINIDKEQVKVIGKTGLRIGKAIVIEGVKALALKTATTAIEKSFTDGLGSIRDLSLDDVLGDKKDKQPKQKKGLSFRKKKEDDIVTVTVEEESIPVQEDKED